MLSWKSTFGLALSLAVLMSPLMTLAVSTLDDQRPRTLEQREQRLSRTMIRASQYVDVPHSGTRAACEQVQAPQAIATPDPLFTGSTRAQKVKVSFIIGTDGRVHSPLILESAGLAGDRRVLQTVRSWRYRPATCNGVPTETEGKVEFSASGR